MTYILLFNHFCAFILSGALNDFVMEFWSREYMCCERMNLCYELWESITSVDHDIGWKQSKEPLMLPCITSSPFMWIFPQGRDKCQEGVIPTWENDACSLSNYSELFIHTQILWSLAVRSTRLFFCDATTWSPDDKKLKPLHSTGWEIAVFQWSQTPPLLYVSKVVLGYSL